MFFVEQLLNQPEVNIRYFVPDERKSGGFIAVDSGKIIKLFNNKQTLILSNGCAIKIDDIIFLEILRMPIQLICNKYYFWCL